MVSDRVLRPLLRTDQRVALYGDLVRGVIIFLILSAIVVLAAYHAALVRYMYRELHMNDFGKFYYSAQMFMNGQDMYGASLATAIPVADGTVRQFWNMNPPHFHLAILPLALLRPATALLLWGLLSLIALGWSLWIVGRELDLCWTVGGVLWVCLGSLVFSATGALSVTGQLTFPLMLAVTIAWREARRGRWLASARWIGLVTSVKPFLGIFIIFLVARRQFREAVTAVITGALVCGVGVLVFGFSNYVSWSRAVAAVNWPWPPMNGSIAGIVARALAPSPLYSPIIDRPDLVSIVTASATVFVGILTVLALRWWAGSGESLPSSRTDRSFAILLLTAQLLTPLGWVYYLWILAGPLLALRHALVPGFKFWQTWLIAAAVPGALFPLFMTGWWRHTTWAPVTLGSPYFWLTAVLWIAVAWPQRGQK